MIIAKINDDSTIENIQKYVNCGIDALITSMCSYDKIAEICKSVEKLETSVPIFVLSNQENTIEEKQTKKAGSKLVIYTDSLLSSVFTAISDRAQNILEDKRNKIFTNEESLSKLYEIIPE